MVLFAIREQRVGERGVIAVEGEIDVSTAPHLRSAIADAVDAHVLWIDLTDVGFMDSTGLSVLAEGHRRGAAGFAVICPDGPVRRVLELSGVDQYLSVFSDRAEADASG